MHELPETIRLATQTAQRRAELESEAQRVILAGRARLTHATTEQDR